MTPNEERGLYVTNRSAWLEYVAPRMAKMIEQRSDAWVNETWTMLPKDYIEAVWQHLNASQRDRIKRLRKVAA